MCAPVSDKWALKQEEASDYMIDTSYKSNQLWLPKSNV